ncbi:MAG: DUF2157 domain-containing protein [Chloroflexi bacterium CFX7]|nr:DUF2157 domain-containing protein [Chloroflexi bacterium CFX7]RIL03239.1 MAG: hypothetical protein DCC78_04205 [bacterium]
MRLTYGGSVASSEEHLERWRAAGILDEAAAERIRAFERDSARSQPETGDREGPGILEALIYLGLAVAAVGVVILVGTSWEDLEDWARIAVVGVPGVLALALGAGLRTLPEPGMVRGGHIAWLAGGVLLSGATAVTGDSAGWRADDIQLATGLVATILALALWVLAPAHPQVLGIGGAAYMLSIALGGRSDEFSFLVAGISLAIVGGAGALAVERGWLEPQLPARAVVAAAITWGAFSAGFDEGWAESLVFVASAAVIALSVWRGGLVYMLAGVAGIFGGLISTITRHVDEETTAALLLILMGALLIAVVTFLARFRPWVRTAVS